MEADTQAITALIETYREGFATLDAEKLESLWDRDYPIIYCPIELAAPLRGWPAVAQYYERVTQHFARALEMEVADLSIDILGDVAYAFFTFRFAGEVRDSGAPHRVAGRNTLLFRRNNGQWSGIHYHKSRTGRY